jgi:hypothetical protein
VGFTETFVKDRKRIEPETGRILEEQMTANTKKINGSGNGNGNGNGRIKGNGHKGMDLLAKTMFKELKNSGYDLGQILDFSGKLISFVHEEIKEDNEPGIK